MITKFLCKDDFYFPAGTWLVSRIFIWTGMLVIAPHLPVPRDGIVPDFGWGVFDAWDSVHYRAIATSGYEFINDGKQHNIAFFPLFPLTIRLLMNLGLPFEIAGTLINNLAFLVTLYYFYSWLKKHCGINTAQWASIVISWCPMSMFTGIIYTEGLYLFLSTATLRAFDEKKYSWTAFWGAMATATRPTGMALIPALILASAKERKPPIAYIASLATATGVLLFSLYCQIQFNDPLAFIAAQKGWRPSFGFEWQGWLNMLMQIPFGDNWYFGWVTNADGGIKDIWHPLLFMIVVVYGVILWYRRKIINSAIFYTAYISLILLLILAEEQLINNLLNVFMVLGAGYLLWYLRQKLTPVMVTYGFCGVGLLLFSGGIISLSRLAYGIVPLNIAIGVWFSHHPRQGYSLIILFLILLTKFAIGFAQNRWIG
ncbi:mannosyltransferase family protein [Cronbergia sp. UHCC 0137]|uniref:mannosyltransferase family protein n=1 Tax=Cronbergia sp. UHCC 0137 TaxID=3110239 RepID=UPI002B21A2D2|nr:mannosyltransferase family protein [Cronbergia sp. UHCC 0137]MEA5619708.1 mannosyltransferase family protein [Cronbergia sp. UHCC 0137]